MSRHLPTISRRQVVLAWIMRKTASRFATDQDYDDGAHYPGLHEWLGFKLRLHNWAERRRWAEGRRLYDKYEHRLFKMPTRKGLL